jgi:hypothetical protein
VRESQQRFSSSISALTLVHTHVPWFWSNCLRIKADFKALLLYDKLSMVKLLAVDESVKKSPAGQYEATASNPLARWRRPFDVEPLRIILQTASVPGCSSNCPDEEQPRGESHSGYSQNKGFGRTWLWRRSFPHLVRFEGTCATINPRPSVSLCQRSGCTMRGM